MIAQGAVPGEPLGRRLIVVGNCLGDGIDRRRREQADFVPAGELRVLGIEPEVLRQTHQHGRPARTVSSPPCARAGLCRSWAARAACRPAREGFRSATAGRRRLGRPLRSAAPQQQARMPAEPEDAVPHVVQIDRRIAVGRVHGILLSPSFDTCPPSRCGRGLARPAGRSGRRRRRRHPAARFRSR